MVLVLCLLLMFTPIERPKSNDLTHEERPHRQLASSPDLAAAFSLEARSRFVT
jgi:hypothetical protein